MGFWFYNRIGLPDHPAGITVSKHETLPVGDFQITEYTWDSVSLWFVDADRFTADERQLAYVMFTKLTSED